jgi:hypothetical protein
MRFAVRALVLALITSAIGALGQSPKPAHPAAPWKRYCQAEGGFCFKYPSSWKMLGDVYAGNGVVVAPVQKDEQALWNEITVAMVAPPKDADQALGLDGVIEQAAAGMREAGQNFQTLQRQARTVDAKPAQLLKAQYREKSSNRDWIEELIFIEGPDNEIYSVALKSRPESMVRLEPVFTEIVRTWTLPEAEPPARVDEPPAPPQTAPADSTPAQPHF